MNRTIANTNYQTIEEQEQKIRAFDKKINEKSRGLNRFVCVFLALATIMIGAVPVQEINLKNDIIVIIPPLFLTLETVYFFLLLYLSYADAYANYKGRRQANILRVLKSVPVSKKAWIRIRLRQLMKFYVPICIVGTTLQCLIAYSEHCFSIWNIVYGIVFFYIYPVTFGFLMLKYPKLIF